MKFLSLALLLLFLAACNRGWTQGDKDKLVTSCVEKAKASAPALDETKLKNYCSCYQANLEKKYPTMGALMKAGPQDMAQEAQSCISLMQ